MSSASFADLPAELRLIVYDIYLQQHRKVIRRTQPSNHHLAVLCASKQLYLEAGPLFRQYVSLKTPRQWTKFLLSPKKDDLSSEVIWADVANDGRMAVVLPGDSGQKPLSQIYCALANMTGLKVLRVFDDLQPQSIDHGDIVTRLSFEEAMFPSLLSVPRLETYELHLRPSTRAVPFERIPAASLRELRLSGFCGIRKHLSSMAELRSLSLHTVTGGFFDISPFQECFPEAQLESFSYAKGSRMAFEIQDHHLLSLASYIGTHLRKLVLVGVNKLTDIALMSCVCSLRELEYFAISILRVRGHSGEFILALPPSLTTVKLELLQAPYYPMDEGLFWNAVEKYLLLRKPPPPLLCLAMTEESKAKDSRVVRWKDLAIRAGITLQLMDWPEVELIEG